MRVIAFLRAVFSLLSSSSRSNAVRVSNAVLNARLMKIERPREWDYIFAEERAEFIDINAG